MGGRACGHRCPARKMLVPCTHSGPTSSRSQPGTCPCWATPALVFRVWGPLVQGSHRPH